MLREIILRQKKEKEEFLAQKYIKREKLDQAKKWLDSDLIKVIMGPRRAGKSVFAFMLLKDYPFGYLNFDDENLFRNGALDTNELMKEIYAVYGKTKYLLFDEIQNLPNWELFINRLHRQGNNLIITGSNAKLLSRELATALTGRHIPIEILPFSFKEFLLAKNFYFRPEILAIPEEKAKLIKLVETYLLEGGYPEVVVKGFETEEYLKVLYNSILFKDVVKRYKVKFSSQIDNLGNFLINNFSNFCSFRKIQQALNFRSVTTLEKYTEYLKDAYLIFTLTRFSFKPVERIKSPKKIYIVDNGFIKAKAIQHSQDLGRLMENLVFVELMKNGFQANRDFFYHKTKSGREIDFVIKEERKVKALIQVCYSLTLESKKREISALIEASQELNCKNLIIITWDKEGGEEIKNKKIKFIPLWKWLIEKRFREWLKELA